MKVALVRIGNSRGIRIPKPLIEECGFGKTVEMHVEDGRVVIEAAQHPRRGWEKMLRAAGPADADELLLEGVGPNAFDEEEWEW